MVGTHLGSEFGVRGLGVQRLRSLGAKEFRVEGLGVYGIRVSCLA